MSVTMCRPNAITITPVRHPPHPAPPMKACRECDTVFPVGARLDSVVTSEELREKFGFEPEFNKDGTPMVSVIGVDGDCGWWR